MRTRFAQNLSRSIRSGLVKHLMYSFRALLSGFLFFGLSDAGFPQETGNEQALLESTPAVPGSSESTGPAYTIKGFIPDMERDKIVEQAIKDVHDAAQLKKIDPKKLTKPQPKVVAQVEATPNMDAVEKDAQERADRANGIVRNPPKPKPTPAPEVKVVEIVPTPKPTPEPVKNLDDEKPVKAETESTSIFADADEGDTIDFSGKITKVEISTGGNLRVTIRTTTDELADIIVKPTVGMRKPSEGTEASGKGEVTETDDRVVIEADTWKTGGTTYSAPKAKQQKSQPSHNEPQRRAPVRRSVPLYPGPPPMYIGPPPPPMFIGPRPPPGMY
jgi:hypothetical protein